MAEPASPTLDARRAQTFPVLAPDEIARMRRFGTPCRYAAGARIYETGKPSPGMLVVLSGTIRITGRDGHGHDFPVVDHVAGSFSGELGQLSSRRSLVDGVAVGDVEALLISPDQLHALLIAEAALGEKHLLLDPANDHDAQVFIERYAPRAEDLPLAVCPDGSVLRNPTESALARCIGMLDSASGADRVYDLAVAGAGPAGLATAVYAASEGLSVLVIDARSFGGQAGASARIENYLGFPTGISGQALAGRAYTQAQKFGATMLIPAEVVRLDCERSTDGNPFALQLADGRAVQSHAVVIATGALYRRPECANLKAMEGRGVWYWASPIEAKMCAGQEVVLVGGGNSAGQAAVFLAGYASKVWLLVRGAGLAASMSKYLIERIAGIANIELRTRTEVIGLSGERESGVESVTWRNRDTKQNETRPICHVFMFLGADPTTEWLKDCDVAVDDKGFITTGNDSRLPLETSVPGVFAIGDVRAGSVKRVGGAIGEGAAAVAKIHAFLGSPH